MTALADMLTPDERQALVDRLDRIRELADLMREPARPGERDDDGQGAEHNSGAPA